MTTNAAWIAAIQAMTVTGVTHHYNEPPPSINTADMPCAFPLLPSGERGELITSCIGNNKPRNIKYVIIVGPVAQDTNANNYATLGGHMDNLETALDALTIPQGGSVGQRIDYTITARGDFPVSEVNHWAIEADVTLRDVF